MNSGKVFVAGLQNDPSVAAVCAALERRNSAYVFWNQRDLLNDCAFRVQGGVVEGTLLVNNDLIDLTSIFGAFYRMSEIELTPEYQNASDLIANHAVSATWILSQWLEVAPIRVMNRGSANDSNSSKAYQLQQIRHHIPVPNTIVTNDIDQVRNFREQYKRVIYKSCSGERSIVTELDDNTLESRAEALKTCPVLFQEYIEGTDIRVHVVGEHIFATAVTSTTIDYRYDNNTTWVAIDLSDKHKTACITLTHALGLELSGIDLRLTPTGEIYCFEVNPSPAFSVYEEQSGQPISDAIAMYLAGDA